MIESAYRDMIKKVGLKPDPGQIYLAELFDKYQQLFDKNKNLINKFKSLFGKNEDQLALKNGLYIWGGVGRGKSMMLDLFFNQLTDLKARRVHFHQFMSDFHRSLMNWYKKNDAKMETAGVISVSQEIASQYQVVLLDELQVNNIADAMVLSRLCSTIMKKGVYLFITSNFHPDDLFKDGLQRDRFLPFIELIKSRLNVYELNNFQDYRLNSISTFAKKYYYPIDDVAKYSLQLVLSAILSEHVFVEKVIKVDHNKEILVLKSYGTTAMFSFAELCKIPLGVLDYIAICNNFSMLIITDIPQMDSENHNEALRFITLIDCLYEKKTKIFCTAEVDIDNLYIGSKHKKEFLRAASRLHQMCER